MVEAGDGDNRVRGGDGHDRIRTGGGDDILSGGRGEDVLDGGGGSDTLIFDSTQGAVNVDLLSGLGRGGEAQGDTYRNIENVRGTDHADILTGSGADNRLFGGAGDDVISGGGGDDILTPGKGADQVDGGAGNDTVSYDDFDTGVRLDLAAGNTQFLDGQGQTVTQTLTHVENIQGSDHNDILIGDDTANHMVGSLGRDRI